MKFSEYCFYLNETLNKVDQKEINKFIELIIKSYEEERMIFIIGNGGSAATASHFAQDLAKGTRNILDQTKRVKALSLTDSIPFITALGNDDGYATIFEQQLRTYAKPNDVLVSISGSGNSPNIIKAVEWANSVEMTTVGISGFNGGKLKKIVKYSLHIPLDDMCTSESIHSVVLHYIVLELQKKIKNVDL
jgi:D-sedoheptulose 7-phosphate isomerase